MTNTPGLVMYRWYIGLFLPPAPKYSTVGVKGGGALMVPSFWENGQWIFQWKSEKVQVTSLFILFSTSYQLKKKVRILFWSSFFLKELDVAYLLLIEINVIQYPVLTIGKIKEYPREEKKVHYLLLLCCIHSHPAFLLAGSHQSLQSEPPNLTYTFLHVSAT